VGRRALAIWSSRQRAARRHEPREQKPGHARDAHTLPCPVSQPVNPSDPCSHSLTATQSVIAAPRPINLH
jgi:hypothetical protein